MIAHFRIVSGPAPRVELAPNVAKIQAAIGFLIKEGERQELSLTQYDIVKSLFVADRAHLNRYGRLITYDNYVAMKHGPVPSLAYDLLKLNGLTMRRYGVSSLPWRRQDFPQRGLGCFRYYAATSDDEALSLSDKSQLEAALVFVTGRSFGEVRRVTHLDRAYKEAWDGVDENSSNPMSLGLLFDSPDYEAAREIAFTSKQAAVNKTDDDEFAIPSDIGDVPAA